MRCPNCKKAELKLWEGPTQMMGVEVFGRGQRCPSCSETLFDMAEVERQEREAASAIVERGIRTGVEFKFIRKMTDLKAIDVAMLLEVRPETVSRWERGEVDIPRAAAFALGELYDRPRVTRAKLERFAAAL